MSDPQGFINSVLPGAVQIQIETGLPAAAMLAEAALETGWGTSIPKDIHTGQDSYNLFGVKGAGPEGSVLANTEEEVNGVMVPILAQFRAYHSYQESLAGYAAVITGQPNFAPAVAVANDPVAYVKELQVCHYATDENYATKLIALMSEYSLIELVEEAVELALIAQDAAGNLIKQGAVPAWATQAVQEAVQLGLLTQVHNPNEVPTVGELCAILLNAKAKGVAI